MCGGTPATTIRKPGPTGLSPRVRGNLLARGTTKTWPRSIPACAGEPGGILSARYRAGVYPRVCGGTAHHAVQDTMRLGLSPRVRGNLWTKAVSAGDPGSIPACAGEPPDRRGRGIRGRVYPRVCGGTPCRGGSLGRTKGLSPRVRGNQRQHRTGQSAHRSIPACAGEPFAAGVMRAA